MLLATWKKARNFIYTLPYAEGFFRRCHIRRQYQYYGADDLYFPCTYSKLVKPGGKFGIVVRD